jgi:hypothetical protein
MANLLDQASIILTPTAYDNGKVLCVKPSAAPYGDFDFSRNSSATRVNAQGLVEDVQILSGNLVQNGDFSEEGSEQVTNGDFATDTDWTKGTGWSISGGTANCDGTQTGNTNLSQFGVFSTLANKSIKISFTVSNYSSGSVRFISGNGALTHTAVSANGVVTLYFNVGANSGTSFNIQGDLNFVGSIDNVSVKEVLQDWSVEDYGAVSASAVITPNTEGVKLEKTVSADWRSSFLVQPISYTNGSQYKVTFKLKNGNLPSGGSVFVRRAYDSSSQSIVNNLTLTNDWVEYTYYFVADSNSEDISFGEVNWQNAGVGEYFYIDDVSVIEVTDDTNLPRINYDGFSYDGSGAIIPNSGCGSWLWEGQSTNLITYSEDFTVWNQIQNVTLISNSTASPSGENNATKFLSTTGSSKVRNNFSVVSGTTYTFSVYCKNIDATFVRLLAYDGLNEFSAYVVSQINTSTWTKVSLTFTATNTSASGQVQIARDLPDGESLYFWGAQLEQQSYATSYIPTEGTTVTRNRDLCTNGGSAALINSTEGTLYFEGSTLANDGTNRYLSINDGTVSNYIYFRYVSTSNQVLMRTQVGGVTINTISTFLTDTTLNTKFALKWKSGDYAFWVNGVEVGTDSSTTIFTANTLNLIEYSFPTDGGGGFPSKTKCLAVFPYLNDTELAELTTI